MKDQLKNVSVLAELDRMGLEYESIGDSEIRILCPFHDDNTPSCAVSLEKNVFMCQTAGCKKSGDILTLFAKVLNTTRRVVWEDLAKRYNLADVKVINPEAVERWHIAVWESKVHLRELHKRGISDAMIRKYRIGFDGSRVTIPVYNEHDQIVNVRCYLPGAPGSQKMRNKRGHGATRLYPLPQLSYDKLVVCGGEMKAIATAERINRYGYGAITATSSEGSWENHFNDLVKDKQIFVCFDVDKHGDTAADQICARLKKFASSIHKIELPLSIDQYPKGDVNDFFGQEKKTGSDFVELLESTKEWEIEKTFEVDENSPVIKVSLADATKAEYTGLRIQVKANVAAIDTAPYVIPKTVKVSCDRSQDGCSMCPVFLEQPDPIDDTTTLKLHPESPAIVDMVAVPKNVQRDALIAGLKMPPCKVVEFRPTEFYNVEDVRLSPQLEITSRAINDVLVPALCIGHGLETNESYVLTGRMYPHPKTQQAVLLVSEAEASQDMLSNYVPDPEDLEALSVFQPKDWTVDGISEKLNNLYDDLSANVTRIFKRHDLHLIIDLAYHSVLFFKFDDHLIKGWVECLITGDSSQGKSESILRLMEHYDLGERIECKNATVAGLLGGLQQLGKRWFVTWGVIPKHDKRLVFMEEIKGTSTEVLGKLTDMRSSGIAEIPKIEKRRTHARTRLVMVSNPRSDRPLSMYNFGVDAVKELIGSPEDIRRFDAILLVSTQEINPDELNRLLQFRPEVSREHKSKQCHDLVVWAWTRNPDQIEIQEDAKKTLLEQATVLCKEFSETIPIVDRGSMRYKLARLSIALACRTHSHKDHETVIVRKCHVDFIVQFLRRIYSSSVFGYKDYSQAIHLHETLIDPGLIKSNILQTPFPQDLIKQLLYTNDIELRDICDWCGWDRSEAMQLLSLFVRKHALSREKRSYRKTSQFIEFLKNLMNSDDVKVLSRPGFIQEEF